MNRNTEPLDGVGDEVQSHVGAYNQSLAGMLRTRMGEDIAKQGVFEVNPYHFSMI